MASDHQDAEKGVQGVPSPDSAPQEVASLAPDLETNATPERVTVPGKLRLWEKRIEKLTGVEARGIRRVEQYEKTAKGTLSTIQIVLMWFSINTAAQNITLTMLSKSVYGLGFVDAALCSVFGGLVGSLPAAYIATWGPISGNRTLIVARFTMGWWPTKICVLLNLVILLGYSMIDAVVAGQMLSAVSPNASLTVVAGIIIVAVITFVVTTFGITVFHYYERYAWIPQWAVLMILAGTAGKKFDTTTVSDGDDSTVAGNRLSFFSLCLSAAITYAPDAADFLVYCDPNITGRIKVFTATLIGLACSFSLCFLLGVGLASGINNDPAWAKAGLGSGGLIVAGYDDLGSFGKSCSVVAALGLVANMVPPIYSAGIDFQILGRYPAMIPRFLWNLIGVIIFAVCALAGRNHLAEVFTNFLALMGYWVAIWIAITLEEQFIFRRGKHPKYKWADWNSKDKLPIGVAAFIAFVIGWVGSILCMAQVYYYGPIAKLVGEYGADLGNYVGFSWAALVYPPLRYFELRRFGR
ncbi:MAG: hypothetical protein M1818_002079 [Claussenomyces sp. TS43310]|nr:MAG: hypothetical protein M1818_002079 [Claussenomyces sp. TS43310]